MPHLALRNAERQQALWAAQERQAVAETFAAVGDIAANVLHHLNNKVGTIPVRVQGIQDKSHTALEDDPYLARNLAEIETSAREAMEAVRSSLAQLHPINPDPVDVAECVNAAVQAAGIPVRCSSRSMICRLPPVIASRQSLVFVFTNLTGERCHSYGWLGAIIVSGSVDGSSVVIHVSDNGPGIAPDLHERVFEFNYTGGKSRLGFGLWWVRTLIVRLGGTITMESDGQHGTTFHSTFTHRERQRGLMAEETSLRALIVEDSQSWQQILTELLSEIGLLVDLAESYHDCN